MTSNLRIDRVCKFCGDDFVAKTMSTKFCGDNCSKKAYKRRKKLERLEESDIETLIDKLLPLLELQQKQFLSVKETSKLLGVSDSSIRNMIYDGTLIHKKVGERVIIRRLDIDSLFS